MVDEDQRVLQRRYEASGSSADGAAWLRARLRAGDLAHRSVRLAAYLGFEPARELLGDGAPRLSPMQRQNVSVWADGMLELARGAEWSQRFLVKICVEGLTVGLRLGPGELPAGFEPRGKVDALLHELSEACVGLPVTADRVRQAAGAAIAELRALNEEYVAALSNQRLSDDPEEDRWLREQKVEEGPLSALLTRCSDYSSRLERVSELLEGKTARTPDDHMVHRALDDLSGIFRGPEHQAAGRAELARELCAWLLGPEGPTPSAESGWGEVVASEVPEGDADLVAALQALTIKSPAKRMFVADLARALGSGRDLSEGQRERARALYRSSST